MSKNDIKKKSATAITITFEEESLSFQKTAFLMAFQMGILKRETKEVVKFFVFSLSFSIANFGHPGIESELKCKCY